MAHIYVDSNAAGAGTGADWANAYTTLKAAAEAAGTAAGDNIWIAHNHAESTAGAVSITFKNTNATPGTAICVTTAGSVPPVSADYRATATISTTGANAITLTGDVYCYGVKFYNGSSGTPTFGLGNGTTDTIILEACVLSTTSTGNVDRQFGTTSGGRRPYIELRNTVMEFLTTGSGISLLHCRFLWRNTASAIGGSADPASLIKSASLGAEAVFRGLDLSGTASALAAAVSSSVNIRFENCKLNASSTVTTPGAPGAAEVVLINCDSGDTNYRTEKYAYTGTQTPETTIVRTGGASDGTTSIAWKLVSTANAEWIVPFVSLPITIWNETLTSQTLTLYGYENENDVPTNREIWMEVEYLGTSGFPQSTFVSTGAADFSATASNYTEDTSSTWGGGDTTTRFKMSATFTAAEKGPITVRIYVAKASATFYIDPEPEIAGKTVSRSFIMAPGVYVNELAGGRAAGNMTGGLQ